MSAYAGPKLITDSLSLHLDVNNSQSYTGTGTSWYDLSSNKLTFTSGGTQTPYSTVNNVKCFNFNSSGYWTCGTGYSAVDMGGDCTLIMMLYDIGHATRRTVFEKAGTVAWSYQQEIACTWEPAPSMSYYSRQTPSYDYAGTAALPTNSWFMLGIKMSTGKSTTARSGYYSINGVPWTSSYTSNSNTALTPAGAIQVGTGYAGTCDSGYVGAILCYNKMLSDAELAQNYHALRGRFGI